MPARVIRELSEDDVKRLAETAAHYVEASATYREAINDPS